jgi:hypothetical protein
MSAELLLRAFAEIQLLTAPGVQVLGVSHRQGTTDMLDRLSLGGLAISSSES